MKPLSLRQASPNASTGAHVFSRRTLLASAGVLALAVVDTGCTSGSSASSTAGVKKGPGPGHYKMDLGGYQGPELTRAKIKLRIMKQNWNPAANAPFNAVVAEFQKAYPNISVTQEYVPYGDLPLKIQTYAAAGNAPDLMMGSSGLVSSYKFGNIARPLKPYFTKSFFDGFMKPMADSVTIDGSFYAIPLESKEQCMQYNTAMFEQAGLTPPPFTGDPKAGWTVEQWFDTFAKLKAWADKSGHPEIFPLAASTFGNGGPGSNYSQLESFWIRGQGSPDAAKNSEEYKTWAGVSPDGKSVDGYLNTSLAVKGMENYQTLFSKNWTPKAASNQQFNSSLAVVKYGGDLQQYDFDFSFSPLPRAKTVVVENYSDALILSASSKYPNEAAALLGALTSVPAQVAWETGWGTIPAQEPVLAGLIKQGGMFATEKYKVLAEVAKNGVGVPRTPGWFAYAGQMNTTVANIALGADPKKALNSATTQIDRLLSAYK